MILDAWSRRVVGYAVSRQIDTRLTIAPVDLTAEVEQCIGAEVLATHNSAHY